MQHLEVSGAVLHIYVIRRLNDRSLNNKMLLINVVVYFSVSNAFSKMW